jgi:hypothetical protein
MRGACMGAPCPSCGDYCYRCRGECSATPEKADPRVDRTGKVWRGERLLGYVDTYRPPSAPPGRWRYVDVAGRTSPERYPTRAAAVAALVAL